MTRAGDASPSVDARTPGQLPRSAAFQAARPPSRYPWERGEAAWLLLGTPWGAAPHAQATLPLPAPRAPWVPRRQTLPPALGPPRDSADSGLDSPPRAAPGCLGRARGGDQGEKEEEDAAAEDEDLPAAALADADSRFADLGGLAVHYKEALPPVRAHAPHAMHHRGRASTGDQQNTVPVKSCPTSVPSNALQ